MHSELRKKNWSQMYGFINPLTVIFNLEKSDEFSTKLSQLLKFVAEDQTFLAPYNTK